MVLRLNQHPNSEDLHHLTPEIVEALRQLLASGAPAKADPRRNDFYELENGSQVFYIHISRSTGRCCCSGLGSRTKHPQRWQPPSEPVKLASLPQSTWS